MNRIALLSLLLFSFAALADEPKFPGIEKVESFIPMRAGTLPDGDSARFLSTVSEGRRPLPSCFLKVVSGLPPVREERFSHGWREIRASVTRCGIGPHLKSSSAISDEAAWLILPRWSATSAWVHASAVVTRRMFPA